jgi:amino acid adenylation domain-containing protein
LGKAGDQERVALLFEHEPAMIAAILGVLKSGKAYVPLEPGHPRERLSYMLEDSDSAVILSDRKNAQLARELSRSSRTVIDIDEIDPATSAENLALTVTPKALAYILYTSGSTGRPKGVMQNHRNVLHHIRCYTNSLHIRADDRLTLFSAYSHDAAVIDIFAALLNGATLYPWKVSEQGLNGLSEWLEGQEVTIYHSTPSLYQSLLDTLDSAVHFPKVRAVVLGGEKAANRHFEGFLGHFSPQAIFCNLYGSTESSFNLLFSSGAQAPPKWNAISIGNPVQDTEVVLLNEDGTVGELYGEIGIRSEHVALGYWRNPELTDAVFLPDPEQETRRLYRTGDIGRLLPDGSIGFLGRRDNQVKIRGYRIELGEIEAVLTQHPAVRQAVVVLRRGTNRPSSMQPRRGELLVGYVVMQPGEVFSVEKLRGHLKQSVPDYMVPAAFVALDSLPLMPNGKLDRRMLPPLEDQAPELETVYVAPRTPIEESLAEIWRKVLGLQRIGAMDNFFALGGHSLLAVQVIHRVGKQFDVEVPLRTLFEKPTIEQFAEVIFERLLVNKNKGHLESVLGEIEALSDDAARSAVGDKRTLAPA